jgi:mono/diheme cytochrome c family protein
MDRRDVVDALIRLTCAAAFIGTAAVTVDAHAQSIERGRQLYENHCQVCHTAQIHGRKNRTVFSAGELREIVERWQQHQGLRWSREEIEDVVRFLGATRYRFTSELGAPLPLAEGH